MFRTRFRLLHTFLLTTIFGCSHLGGAPIGELAELFTMGRSRQLQDPLREVRGETRVLIFALDGVGRDVLYGALGSGRMPNLAAALGGPQPDGAFANAHLETEMLSIFPSATIPAWTATFTGQAPGVNGVPGNEWLDRREATFHAPVPMSVRSRSHATKLITDEYLSERIAASTLYERLPPMRMHVSVNPVYRGADLVTFPDLARFGDLVGATIGESLAGDVTGSARVAREMDQTATGSLLHVIEDVGLPDLQTVYFNGIDLMTHYADDPRADQVDYLESVTDSLIADVLQSYRSHGALEKTYIVLISDHGHTPVLNDDRHALSTDGADEPGAVLEAAGFRLRPWNISAGSGDFQAAFAYQGFSAFVYLADRSTCLRAGDECDWVKPPRLEEDVIAAARALHEGSESGAGDGMAGALDLILARDPAEPGSYLAFDGEALMPLSEYLLTHPRPDLLRLEQRLEGLATGPFAHLSGDLLLLAHAGDDRPIGQRFYFGDPKTSEHGGAHAADSRIPLIVAHPGLSGEALERTVRGVIGNTPTQLDFAGLVEALLSGDPPLRAGGVPLYR
jgi:hypothetical protein